MRPRGDAGTTLFRLEVKDLSCVIVLEQDSFYRKDTSGRLGGSAGCRRTQEEDVALLELNLSNEEIAAIDAVVDELAQRYDTVESAEFQREAKVFSDELPRRVRLVFNDYRGSEAHGALLVTGLPVDDSLIGATPAHWANKPVPSPSIRVDIAFYLLSCLLGEPIGWATQQDGYIMHDVFPIKGHEKEQIGSGSEELLVWHTEDAYHPLRTDYLGLVCLRNPDDVSTTMADIADVRIDSDTAKVLSEKRFRILPDHSHRAGDHAVVESDPKIAELRARSHARVEQALAEPEPVAVLFGDPDAPYLCIDPHFMKDVQGPVEQQALDVVGAAIDEAMREVVLRPGAVVFIDNYRMVHGRKPFKARHDGTDRWLRRLNVARDLRKSRDARPNALSRVIY